MCKQVKILGQQTKMEVLRSFSLQLFKDLFFINCWIFAKSFLENSGTTQNHHEVAEQSPWSATILKTYKCICPWRMMLQMGILHNKSCTEIHEVVERNSFSRQSCCTCTTTSMKLQRKNSPWQSCRHAQPQVPNKSTTFIDKKRHCISLGSKKWHSKNSKTNSCQFKYSMKEAHFLW